jgi:DNA-binding transcriptional LysR family regulator
MDLTHLRSLVAVSENGGIGAAAEILGITQSALSRRIGLLEEELGAELVERQGRGVILTEMGRLAVSDGQAIIERYERLKEDVSRLVRLQAGVVRVGGGASAVSYLLPRAIGVFRREHPEVRFEVREVGSRDVERAVSSEALELGVVTLPTSLSDLHVQPLMRDRIVLVAGKGHPLAKKRRVSLKDLHGQRMVGFEAGSAIRLLIDSALREAEVSMNVVMELRSIAAILRMVETTGSLAFVSEMGAEKARVVEVRGLRVERQLALITKKGRALSPAAAEFSQLVARLSGVC